MELTKISQKELTKRLKRIADAELTPQERRIITAHVEVSDVTLTNYLKLYDGRKYATSVAIIEIGEQILKERK